jgi:hypothetical protein
MYKYTSESIFGNIILNYIQWAQSRYTLPTTGKFITEDDSDSICDSAIGNTSIVR